MASKNQGPYLNGQQQLKQAVEYEFRLGAYANLVFHHPLVLVIPEDIDTFGAKHCRECSRPERPVLATHGELCVYCKYRDGNHDECVRMETANDMRSFAARTRLDAFDKRNAPRVTAESRELAKSHPWSNADEGEP